MYVLLSKAWLENYLRGISTLLVNASYKRIVAAHECSIVKQWSDSE